MNTFWLRVRLGLLTAGVLYVLIFIALNHGARVDQDIHFLFFSIITPNVFVLLVLDSIASIIGWELFLFVFRAMLKIRHSRSLADAQGEKLAGDERKSAAHKAETHKP
jgi:hypothetical protein